MKNGFKHGRAHFLRQRCLAVLLKAQGLSSQKIAKKVDFCQQSINKWVDGFISESIAGLGNRSGQGAKPIIGKEVDEETIRQAIEGDRQSVKAAKATWDASSGKDGRGDVQTFFIRIGARYRRILKGKWIKLQDYISKDNLFYAANRALENVGKILYVNFKNYTV